MFDGADILKTAKPHKGETYILGAVVPMANKDWTGPWDCAEFVSWCAYRSYKIMFGVRPPNPMTGESYSGWWMDEARAAGVTIPVAQAINTPGAILIRSPGAFGRKVGHVAISCGDGSTIEAHSHAVGVAIIGGAATRPWSTGATLPGVDYVLGNALDSYVLPDNVYLVRDPFMRGPAVKKIQDALKKAGLAPGKIDGVYGHLTAAAVASFQAQEGLVVDGCVGPQTAKALKLK